VLFGKIGFLTATKEIRFFYRSFAPQRNACLDAPRPANEKTYVLEPFVMQFHSKLTGILHQATQNHSWLQEHLL
jgi:hypothetical protein